MSNNLLDIQANYFKIETFGAVDGPGVRLIVFLQGCSLRCLYCHNPESWKTSNVNKISVGEVIDLYQKNKAFYKNGGITLSGGEPLLQLAFVYALAKMCQLQKIHLVLDTSAANFNNINKSQYLKIIKCHPLWLIDIKHITEQGHKYITGSEQLNELALIKLLEGEKQNYWIRQVLVPGLTDKPKDLVRLGRFLKGLKYCQRFELLPYHKLGVNKYKQLEIKYPLLKTKLPTNHDLSLAKMHINKGLK